MDLSPRKYKFIEELLHSYEENSSSIELTESQKSDLGKMREDHLSGKTSSLSLEEFSDKFKQVYGK